MFVQVSYVKSIELSYRASKIRLNVKNAKYEVDLIILLIQ